MRRRALVAGVLTGAAVLVAAALGGAVALSDGDPAAATAGASPASTAAVQQGELAAAVAQDGILTYRARPDGSPFSVTNHARGTYTALPEVGEEVDCGGVLYRVDDQPVLLLCGTLPAYRALQAGDAGRDVRQLNRHLRVRGAGDTFTSETMQALAALQRRRGGDAGGALAFGDAVFLPGPLRIAKVTGRLGGSAQPGAPVLNATSGTPHVQVSLDPSEQRQVARGDRAQVTLPGSRTVTGRVAGFGRTAKDATIPTSIRLAQPGRARGLDGAPVQVLIATEGVDDVLSVPVTALIGRAGGGFAVEAVRAGDQRELVAVRVGLFDTAAGRVEVEGDLRAGDRVAVPSS